MPITQQMFPALIQAASKEGSDAFEQGAKGAQAQRQAKLQSYLKGQEQQRDIKALQQMKDSGLVEEGGQAKAGEVSTGADPYAHQAQAFLKTAGNAYKGIHDQLDSSKATLDNLNLGNSTGDKLALINEAKLSLAGSGGRAIGQMVALLSGDDTMKSDSQKAMNWLQNTPNIPTLQPAQRDAIRESVFGRLPQIGQQHQQTQAQLMQQGAIAAPQTDSAGLVSSFSKPAQQKLDQLGQMHQEYQTARAKMAPQNPVSTPSTANANPTTLDRLKSFFSPKPQAQPQPSQEADPIGAELAKRAKGALQQQAQQPPQPGQGQ